MIGRVPIFDISPSVSGGQFPVKAIVGEQIQVSATVFCEGRDVLGARAVLTSPTGVVSFAPMFEISPGSDRWAAMLTPTTVGDWQFRVEAWHDPIATWIQMAQIKIPANSDAELVLEEGARIFEELFSALPADEKKVIQLLVENLRDQKKRVETRLEFALDTQTRSAISEHPLRHLLTLSDSMPLQVDRERALVGSWYEFFPRSEGAVVTASGKSESGTFKTATARLAEVAAMGFDVLYLPPIHPIGTSHRKGKNNTLTPGPMDPGVPWAIGSKDGGHDCVNPELGTVEDFEEFVRQARILGLEIALDFALQASPDHPWVTEHPEWFTKRADGSIAYAENPPKKYEDIYPINFDNDYAGILRESIRIIRLWMTRGVTIFRVDNPHTKPLHFWHDLLADIRTTDPDVIFLAEAFTKPSMTHALGKVGFHQSYTYFTWRTTKSELVDYGQEVSQHTLDFFRPNFWVNTPDILPYHLQSGAPEMFALRAILAATMSPSWGMYAGYELFEHEALAPGTEEYLDSEKYQLRPRDWQAASASGNTLSPLITKLNELRKSHPSLQRLRNLRFHSSDHEQVLVYSKSLGEDRILVVANLEPTKVHETWIHLDLRALEVNPVDEIEVEDLLTGHKYKWREDAFVRFDPRERVAHILKVL